MAALVRSPLVLIAIALSFVLAGCDSGEEAEPAAVQPQYEGLSREQIEAGATPMTPEEAERLGIVDSTILIQPPMNPDSVVPLDSAVIQ